MYIENNISNITEEKFNYENFGHFLLREIKIMDKILVIDRFEGDIAICEIRESGELIEVEKSKLPKDATDGTVLRYKNGEYIIDIEGQKKIEERIQELMRQVWNN